MSLPYPAPTSPAISAVMRGNRKHWTRPERLLRSALHRSGLRYRTTLTINANGVLVRPDLVFTRQKLAVFMDGCFWHSCPIHGTRPRANVSYWGPKLARNRDRDGRVNHALTAAGWHVLRVWEHQPIKDATLLISAQIGRDQLPLAQPAG